MAGRDRSPSRSEDVETGTGRVPQWPVEQERKEHRSRGDWHPGIKGGRGDQVDDGAAAGGPSQRS
jgi:hypothetical protein